MNNLLLWWYLCCETVPKEKKKKKKRKNHRLFWCYLYCETVQMNKKKTEKNHRLFWWYLCCETVTLSWGCSLISSTFKYTDGANFLAEWFQVNFLSLCCLMTCLGFLLMLGALLFFHSYLIYTGQTTWEVLRTRSISYMRGVPKDVYPFSEGGCTNIKSVCLRPLNSQPRIWPSPEAPFKDTQRFWWIENEYYSCF
jgi:palmitoyltransferase